MHKLMKPLASLLACVLLVGLVPGSDRFRLSPAAEEPPVLLTTVPPVVSEAISTAAAEGDEFIAMEFQAPTPQAMAELQQAIAAAGGQVIELEQKQLQARIPVAAAASLPLSSPVAAIGINQQLQLDLPAVATVNQVLQPTQASSLTAISMDAMGVTDFRTRTGATGSGVIVAVVDSGIDPVHPALASTPNGQRKLIDYKDFTGEGYVLTNETVPWGATYQASDGRTFRLPARPALSQGARFGFWEEYHIAGPYIDRDLDQNRSQVDRFGVLLVDARTPGVHDTVYVDSNNNGDFNDEVPMRLFSVDGSTGRLGRVRGEGALAQQRLAFAVADLDAGGKWVSFGFDGLGHGTQVAGVLGGYLDGGYSGVATGVQIMALKAMRSTGYGDWFAVRQAIRYAATNGAQIINVSVGGLASAAARSDSTASEWLNEIARQYNVLIVLAADNSGPGLSSGATLGNPSEVMAVGAYYSPAMWQRDFDYVVPFEGVWALSGMGPRSDGSYVPNVVAPGGSPTTSPFFRHSTGYTTEVGTSIATPHVSGAAALLIDAAGRRGVQQDRLTVKRAIEMGARNLLGFGVYEQGHGLINLVPALGHLEQINSVPSIRARTQDGSGGLLARSYRPGSISFDLTNLGTELERVNVFSSEPWVRSAFTSLTLPPGVSRQLPLEISPPNAGGVNSAFLLVTNPEKYGPSVTLPITHVQALDLSAAPDQRHTVTETVEAARYRRYFYEVKPGTASLSISLRMLLNTAGASRGTAQVQVFRPDGRAVHRAELGANGTGLATLFQHENPVEGVWEVVVTAMPDKTGTNLHAAFTLEAQIRPGVVARNPIQLTVPAGSTTTHPFRFTNIFAPFTGKVEAVGMVRLQDAAAWAVGVPWRVEKRVQSVVEDFTLREWTGQMRVEIDNPVPSDVDLNLYLYHLEGTTWRLMGQSVQPGTSREAIELTSLPPGRYQVHTFISGKVPAGVQYHYRRLMAVEGYHLTVKDTEKRRERNEAWNTDLTIRAPLAPGRYQGQLLLRDTVSNKVLAWVPFEVSVGQPALLVEALPAQLTASQRSYAVLEVRDAATGKLVDAPVVVNGQRFISRKGQVRVPLTPQGAVQVLDVTVSAPAYQFFQRQISLPVRERSGTHPLGVDPREENLLWRRKVQSQLQ